MSFKRIRKKKHDRPVMKEDVELNKFISAVDQTKDAIFITNIDGIIEYINPAFEKITGFKRGEVIGKTPRIIKSGEHEPRFYEELWSKILAGKAFRDILVNKTKQGDNFIVDHSITPVKDKKGNITHFIGIWKDITKRRKTEDEERENLVRFTHLFEQSPLSIQIFDPKGRSLKVNKAWEKLWNIPSSKLKNYNILNDKQLAKKGVMHLIKKAFTGSVVEIPPIRYEPAKTKKIKGIIDHKWTKVFMYPIKDDKEDIKEVVLIHQDITPEIEAENKLETSRKQLNAILQSVSDGIAVQNKNKDLVYANDALAKAAGFNSAADMLGLKKHEFLKRLARFKISDENGNHLDYEDLPGQIVLDGKGYNQKVVSYFDRKKGVAKWSLVKASPVYDNKDKIEYAVNVISDITKQKRLESILKFLAESGKVLSSSLDNDFMLQQIAELAVPVFADWCVVDMLEGKKITMKALAHKDPKKIIWAKNVRRLYSPKLTDNYGVGKVISTGKFVYFKYANRRSFKKILKNERLKAMLKKIGFTSVMIVPIKIKNKVVGTFTFVTTKSTHRFTQSDLHFALQLASQISISAENSLLYQDIKNEKQRLIKIVSNVPGVVWEAYGQPDKKNQKIGFVNNYVKKMLGYSVKEWLSSPNFWLKLVHPDDRERAAREAAEIYNSAVGGISRFRWIAKDGRAFWVEAQSQVIKNDKGEPIGMRGVTMDITEREEIERKKDEFISMASHELRTPLTSLNIYTKILQDSLDLHNKKRTETYFGNMSKQLDRLNSLVAKLLDVSVLSTGGLHIDGRLFSLEKTVKESVANMKQMTNGRSIILKGSIGRKVWGDPNYIDQVLTSLLANAIKYSPKSSDIEVKIKANKESVIVGVKDHGFGIAKEHQEKIFERFYRVYDKVDRTYPGLGMGLYISREIIKSHGGNMWLKSESGKGSVFYFSLPYNKFKVNL